MSEVAVGSGCQQFFLLEAERSRASMVENFGACLRIKGTPIPQIYLVNIHRFLFVYMLALPIILTFQLKIWMWIAFVLTFSIGYAVLALDEIAYHLHQPFDPQRLNPIPVKDIVSDAIKDIDKLMQSNCTENADESAKEEIVPPEPTLPIHK